MTRRRALAVHVSLLLLLVAIAGCMGDRPASRARSNPVRLGGGGGAFVDGDETGLVWSAGTCTLSSAVLLYPKAANQTAGEYVVADLRDEYPNTRIGTFSPTLGPIYGNHHSILACRDVAPINADFILTFRSLRVDRPAWDQGTNASVYSAFSWFATDNEELSTVLRERTNLTVRDLVAAASEPITDNARRFFYDVPTGQDIDAVFAQPVTARSAGPVYRFWADRPELQPSGGTQFVPVAITITAGTPISTQRFEQGTILGRRDFAPAPLFTAAGQLTVGNVTVFDDVTIEFAEPSDHLLRETWLMDETG